MVCGFQLSNIEKAIPETVEYNLYKSRGVFESFCELHFKIKNSLCISNTDQLHLLLKFNI